jgi:hypothetical protein
MATKYLVEVVTKCGLDGRPRLRRFFVTATDRGTAWRDVARRFTMGGDHAGEMILDSYVTGDPYKVAAVRAVHGDGGQ